MNEFDHKASEQLREVLSREQMMRLYQIRMQVRPVAESLASEYVARRLELTEEQRKKAAEIAKGMLAKQLELFREFRRSVRDATQEQRTQLFQKSRKLGSEADKEALKGSSGQ